MKLREICALSTLLLSVLIIGACGGTETTSPNTNDASAGATTGGGTGTGGIDMTGAGGSAGGSCNPACGPERSCSKIARRVRSPSASMAFR